MADNLRRVNPVLPDLLDTRVWEGNKQGRQPKKQRGDRRTNGPSAGAEPEDDGDPAPAAGLIDVRI